jgi:chaperonin GroES
MSFRPLHDRVVVKRVAEEEKTKGGIIIPDTAKEKPMEGEIVAVGPGARDEKGALVALDVKVGDRILFGKWSGTEVKLDGVDLLIMKESDIMGILEAPAKAAKKAA